MVALTDEVSLSAQRREIRGSRHVSGSWIRLSLLIAGLLFIGIPFVWIVSTAFKTPLVANASPPILFSAPTLDNFRLLADSGYFGALWNSIVITAVGGGLTLVFGLPAGYGLARGRFRGRLFLAGFLLFSRMVPPVIFIIPLFLFFHYLNLIGTYTGIVLAYMSGLLPFTVWMSSAFFAAIPREIEEAARIDGCGRFRTFWSIVLPLSRPGVGSVALLIGFACWSEYFIPLIIGNHAIWPAPVKIATFVGIGGASWGAMAAGALLLIVPLFVITLFTQKTLLSGIMAGAVKG